MALALLQCSGFNPDN